MSETEELKKNAAELKARTRWSHFELAVLVTWQIAAISDVVNNTIITDITRQVAYVLWFMCAFYSWAFVIPKVFETLKEIDGAFEVLRILGYLSPRGEPRRPRKIWEEGAQIVRGWFERKQKAQSKAYAPA